MSTTDRIVFYHVSGTLIARNDYPSGTVETDVQVDAIVPSYPNGARYAVALVAQKACATDDHYACGPDLKIELVREP